MQRYMSSFWLHTYIIIYPSQNQTFTVATASTVTDSAVWVYSQQFWGSVNTDPLVTNVKYKSQQMGFNRLTLSNWRNEIPNIAQGCDSFKGIVARENFSRPMVPLIRYLQCRTCYKFNVKTHWQFAAKKLLKITIQLRI